MSAPDLRPLSEYIEYPAVEMERRATDFLAEMQRRRTVREFSGRPVPKAIVERCIRTAMTAPSGANMQPWYFVVVEHPDIKRQIRLAAEEIERDFYGGRASEEWLQALEPLGTDADKPFLERAPYLIVVFAQMHGVDDEGRPMKHYYVNESVGIATGMLITALHHAGLVSLTHTPSPMRFLNRILERPAHERPFLLLAVGYPASTATVPEIGKKSFEHSCRFC